MPEINAARRLLLPAMLAMVLGGCSTDLGNFNIAELNPLNRADPLRSADYNYFYRRDQAAATGIVTAADLVGPDGRCAYDPAPTFAPAPAAAPSEAIAQSPAEQPASPRNNQALYFTAGPETGRRGSAPGAVPPEVRTGPRGIALQMTECEVVRVAGSTDQVEIGANERGQRTVTLSYMRGDRPGIYRFVGGRLASMERVAEPPQPKKPQKPAKTAKKSNPRQ